MRNLILILSLTSTLFFSSCSSDNDNNDSNITENLLIGEWEFDDDPGYGDPTFYENGKVEVHYFNADWGDDFSEWGEWTLSESSLKIFWDDADSGSEVYDTNVIELTETKLVWKVVIDGELSQESFTRK
ncbi:hypothetical protein IX49_04505 [Cellulophaga lytica]|uniref:lipocalin family protein n=1 Tax=Cellulophaga lytica TaxID=979 RepID=UPI0004F66DC7|nr:lipocalin family protein [Cellulophaga lytica]AIM59816.1 hypothetical protein IX49_04505 [Cellulophaga lytica]